MTMKKRIAAALAVMMTMSLIACGSSNNASSNAPAKDDGPALYEKGKLTVAMCNDYPPYEGLNAKGELEGFDVDIAAWVAKEMGLELNIKQMGFQECITAVQMGECDISISAFGYKEDRDVLFSKPYITATQVLVVNKNSGITSADQLAGKQIAAGTGTTCEAAAKEAVPEALIVYPGDYTQMFAALQAEAVDAVAAAGTVAKNYTDAYEELVALDPPMTTEGTYIIAKKDNNPMMDAVNAALDVIMADSAYAELMSSWGIGD